MLTQGFKSAAGTPAGGRHCDSRDTAGLAGPLCSRKGRVWTCTNFSADLARAATGSYFVYKSEQVGRSPAISAQNRIGPAPITARPGQSSAHSNCAYAVLLTKSGETQTCLHCLYASSDKGEALARRTTDTPVNAMFLRTAYMVRVLCWNNWQACFMLICCPNSKTM